MKYMILLYGSQVDYDLMAGKPTTKGTFAPEDFGPLYEHMGKLNQELIDSGEFVDGQGLTEPILAKRIHLQNGVPVVTDGPYAETLEVVAGYSLVECESIDRAIEIARRLVEAPAPGDLWQDSYVDIRPVQEFSTDG